MSRKSFNGQLKPISTMTITDEYIGHFLKVGYIQSIQLQKFMQVLVEKAELQLHCLQ